MQCVNEHSLNERVLDPRPTLSAVRGSNLSGGVWPQISCTFKISPPVEPFQTAITLCNGNTVHH